MGVWQPALEDVVRSPAESFKGRRVLVTGHTGFKGSWLCMWLSGAGAEVHGLALRAQRPSLFEMAGVSASVCSSAEADICDLGAVRAAAAEARPEFVFHLAAQAQVRRSLREPLETVRANALGTATVLEAVRLECPGASVVLVTSDKCYRNEEWAWGYRETDRVGGLDPYGASKACAEAVADSWRESFRLERLSTARAGNVVGGGDFSADRIIPDAVRAALSGAALRVRSPRATRPWQYVLEPLRGYMELALAMERGSAQPGCWNFGPPPGEAVEVREVVREFFEELGSGRMEEDPTGAAGESTRLALCPDKALALLGWRTVVGAREAARLAARWYRSTLYGLGGGRLAAELCREEIQAYERRLGEEP